MAMNKVRLEICGAVYLLSADGEPAYYEELGKTLDEKMRSMMNASDRITVTGAAVLSALDYLDELHRSNDGADNLRSQLKSYFEDAMSAKAPAWSSSPPGTP